jgi:hypothetical protein
VLKVLSPSFTLKMEASVPSEMLVTDYQMTRHHIPEDCKFNDLHVLNDLHVHLNQNICERVNI